MPTVLFYGKNDYLADTTDVEKLIEEAAPSNNIIDTIFQETFAHLDYTWGVDANVIVYDKVVQYLLKYSSV